MINDLSAEYVRSVLDYDPATGVFTWRDRPREHFATQRSCSTWNARYAVTVAGVVKDYVEIKISGTEYFAHRLAWLYMTGEWPEHQIDHINCDKLDNRFANLREATKSENGWNRGSASNNTSGVKGVNWDKKSKKWHAQISANGKKHNLGYFDCLAAASFAYQIAADKLHGKFARVA